MSDVRVAKRYAAALFEVAQRDAIIDAVSKDIALIERLYAESSLLKSVLHQPLVSEQRKSSLLSDVFGDRITATTLNFLKLLIHKRRIDMLRECLDEFNKLVLEHSGIVDATAKTAIELTADQQAKLKSSLESVTGKTIRLTTEVDNSIIGGVIVRIGDDVIDGSISGRLQRLEQRLLGTSLLGGAI